MDHWYRIYLPPERTLAMNALKPSPPPRKKLTTWKKCVFALLAMILGLVLLEGITTGVAIAYDLAGHWGNPQRVTELSEEKHAQYDEELGWVNIPGKRIEDHYGPGKTITINSQGLRGLQENDADDVFRMICLGDSFTLGYGVDDRETFPYFLNEKLPESTEVVNMGQGGYSVGQSYLWLKRLSPELKPDLVVCVFITEDFRRLNTERTANGFGTPQFEVRGNRIEVNNIPVPQKLAPGTTLPATQAFSRSLQTHSTLAKTLKSLIASETIDEEEQALYLGAHVLLEIQKLCQKMDCGIVVALTPTLPEVFDMSAAIKYQQYSSVLNEFLTQKGIPFRDLSPAFDSSIARAYFLDESFHHYSPQGNRVVAEALHEWIKIQLEITYK